MTQNDKDLYLVKKVTVNLVEMKKDRLEALINCVVLFRYNRETKTLSVYLREIKKYSKERLFKELKQIELNSGYDLKEFAVEWYGNNLEELRIFA